MNNRRCHKTALLKHTCIFRPVVLKPDVIPVGKNFLMWHEEETLRDPRLFWVTLNERIKNHYTSTFVEKMFCIRMFCVWLLVFIITTAGLRDKSTFILLSTAMEHLVKELNVLLKLLEHEHVSSATAEKMSVVRNLLGQLKPSGKPCRNHPSLLFSRLSFQNMKSHCFSIKRTSIEWPEATSYTWTRPSTETVPASSNPCSRNSVGLFNLRFCNVFFEGSVEWLNIWTLISVFQTVTWRSWEIPLRSWKNRKRKRHWNTYPQNQ